MQHDYDALEHARYGEKSMQPSSHDLPVPGPLYKPLHIDNGIDKHDIKIPNNWNEARKKI